jgi:formylglycine-generating enzyme required for sulfatase activity
MVSRRMFLTQLFAGSSGSLLAAAEGTLVRHRVQSRSFEGSTPGELRQVEGIDLCWCPPGAFTMGSPPEETGHRGDEAQVRVTLTRGFWTAKYEATQKQWRQIVGAFPDEAPSPRFGEGDDVPAYWINFEEAERFCGALTDHARRSSALPATWEFRLPTEAQWEYACRAGTVTATAFGNRLGRRQANFGGAPLNGGDNGPAERRATKVGSYPANPWGICDMHGNVFEWCRDWYHEQLPGGSDPDLYTTRGVPNRDGTYSRVRRGGAWNDDGVICRSAFRLRYEPPRRSDHIGFRVVAVRT